MLCYRRMKILAVLILSLPLLSNEKNYIYLDCGEETKDVERQNLLLRVVPDLDVETLDANLKWTKGYTLVNLDKYVSESSLGYFSLSRDTLELSFLRGFQPPTQCSITSEEKISEEIESIKNKKKAKQKI